MPGGGPCGAGLMGKVIFHFHRPETQDGDEFWWHSSLPRRTRATHPLLPPRPPDHSLRDRVDFPSLLFDSVVGYEWTSPSGLTPTVIGPTRHRAQPVGSPDPPMLTPDQSTFVLNLAARDRMAPLCFLVSRPATVISDPVIGSVLCLLITFPPLRAMAAARAWAAVRHLACDCVRVVCGDRPGYRAAGSCAWLIEASTAGLSVTKSLLSRY